MGLDPQSLPNSQFSDFYDGIRRGFEGGVLRNWIIGFLDRFCLDTQEWSNHPWVKPGIIAKILKLFWFSTMALAEFSKEVFPENEWLAFLAVSAWILRKDHFIHGFNPGILAKFDSSMFFHDGICRAFKGDVLQKLNDWPFWPFMLGHVGRINSSMGLSPASLPNLTVLRFSMMAFAEFFKEVFSETERLALLAVYAWALTKINSSMGLSPASLPNLTVLCFSMMAFAKNFQGGVLRNWTITNFENRCLHGLHALHD